MDTQVKEPEIVLSLKKKFLTTKEVEFIKNKFEEGYVVHVEAIQQVSGDSQKYACVPELKIEISFYNA